MSSIAPQYHDFKSETLHNWKHGVFLAILGVLLLIGAAVEWYSKRSGSNK